MLGGAPRYKGSTCTTWVPVAHALPAPSASVPVSGAMIRAQIKALSDLPAPRAIKLGMLPTTEAAAEVAD